MRYIYWAYGLRVESDFLFPELQVVNYQDKPDVIIKRGTVPTALENAVEK